MKIISWNCGGKFREKYKEIIKTNADIFIIQECEDPCISKNQDYKEWAMNYRWIGREKNKGLGVFASKSIQLETLDWDALCLKFFLPVKINNKFDLLAVWTQNPYIEEYYIYQQLNKKHYSESTIIFGDFNSNKKFDNKYVTRKERGHAPTVNELKVLGLEDAYHYKTGEEQGKETKNTFYLYRHKDRGFHIDHCFISPIYLKNYQVMDENKWLKFSDHMPCVLEII